MSDSRNILEWYEKTIFTMIDNHPTVPVTQEEINGLCLIFNKLRELQPTLEDIIYILDQFVRSLHAYSDAIYHGNNTKNKTTDIRPLTIIAYASVVDGLKTSWDRIDFRLKYMGPVEYYLGEPFYDPKNLFSPRVEQEHLERLDWITGFSTKQDPEKKAAFEQALASASSFSKKLKLQSKWAEDNKFTIEARVDTLFKYMELTDPNIFQQIEAPLRNHFNAHPNSSSLWLYVASCLNQKAPAKNIVPNGTSKSEQVAQLEPLEKEAIPEKNTEEVIPQKIKTIYQSNTKLNIDKFMLKIRANLPFSNRLLWDILAAMHRNTPIERKDLQHISSLKDPLQQHAILSLIAKMLLQKNNAQETGLHQLALYEPDYLDALFEELVDIQPQGLNACTAIANALHQNLEPGDSLNTLELINDEHPFISKKLQRLCNGNTSAGIAIKSAFDLSPNVEWFTISSTSSSQSLGEEVSSEISSPIQTEVKSEANSPIQARGEDNLPTLVVTSNEQEKAASPKIKVSNPAQHSNSPIPMRHYHRNASMAVGYTPAFFLPAHNRPNAATQPTKKQPQQYHKTGGGRSPK